MAPDKRGPRAALAEAWARHFPSGSLRHGLASGAFWSLVGATGARGSSLVAGIVIARMLGKETFGLWGIVLTTAGEFAGFASLGLALTATRYVAELRVTDPARAGRALSFCLVVALISVTAMALACAAASHVLAYRFFEAPALFIPLILASLVIFGNVGTSVMQGALAGFEDFRSIARSNVVQGVGLLAAGASMTCLFGLTGTVIGAAIAWLAALLVCVQRMVRNARNLGMPLGTKGIWQERSILWHFSIPSVLTGAVVSPVILFCQSVVARAPGGLMGLGGYQACLNWRGVVLFVPEAVRRVTLPMLSRLRGLKDQRRFILALWANIALNGGVAIAAAIPLVIFGRWILSWYGPAYPQDWDMMVVLIGSGVVQAINDVVTQVTAAMKKMWWNFGIHVVWAAVMLGAVLAFVPTYGVRGYAYALAIATANHMLLNTVAAMVFVRKFAREEAPAA